MTVFEDDGDTGYFYALDVGRDHGEKIVDAIQVYRTAEDYGDDDRVPILARIVWSKDGSCSGIEIDGHMKAVFDFSNRVGSGVLGFPLATNGWARKAGRRGSATGTDSGCGHGFAADDHPSSLRSGGCSPLNTRSLDGPMSAAITRDERRNLLEDWQSSKRTSSEVHNWAEIRYAVDEWECEDDVTNEVLAALDVLDMNLLTQDDVPVLHAMLRLPPGQAARAAELLDAHFVEVNLDERKKTLASEPMYAPFCGK